VSQILYICLIRAVEYFSGEVLEIVLKELLEVNITDFLHLILVSLYVYIFPNLIGGYIYEINAVPPLPNLLIPVRYYITFRLNHSTLYERFRHRVEYA
jgi:hypothetical protein